MENKGGLDKRRELYLGWVYELAQSQGLYARYYNQLHHDTSAMQLLLQQDFKEPLDLVLWYES